MGILNLYICFLASEAVAIQYQDVSYAVSVGQRNAGHGFVLRIINLRDKCWMRVTNFYACVFFDPSLIITGFVRWLFLLTVVETDVLTSGTSYPIIKAKVL